MQLNNKPIKIAPTAQIIRLDSSSINVPTKTISSDIQSNSTTLQQLTSPVLNTQSNFQNNTSTIVKLTSQQTFLNGSNNSLTNNANNLIQTNSSFGQLLNLNNQNLKHFVLPKTSQKLVILPSANSNNNLNSTSIKKNFLISSNNGNSSNSNFKILTQVIKFVLIFSIYYFIKKFKRKTVITNLK